MEDTFSVRKTSTEPLPFVIEPTTFDGEGHVGRHKAHPAQVDILILSDIDMK